MKIFEVDWKEKSTIRGAVWLGVFVIGSIGILLGKDISQLMLMGAGVAGGLGVGVKD